MTSIDLSNDDKPTSADTPARQGGMRRVLSLRDFRLLLAGSSASLIGDQFALLATPWLVLQLSDDPLALGIVLALEGIPRAVFMLVGGAVTDRVSPRRVMLATDIARGVLTAAMAAIVLAGPVQMWMLYGFALGFGLIAGFAAYSRSTAGVGLAFGIDATTFAFSATTFALMRPPRVAAAPAATPRLLASISEGLRQLWDDEVMRFVFCVLAAVNLFAVGPLLVGIPLLAHQRFAAGAMAFGVLMAAFAVGNLAGHIVAGATRLPSSATMGGIVIGVLAGHGVVIASLGLVAHVGVGAALLAGLGALSKWDLNTLFLLSGSLVLATTAWAATNPGLRAFTNSLTKAQPPQHMEDS